MMWISTSIAQESSPYCRHVGGTSGPTVVFLLHAQGNHSGAVIDTARQAIVTSPFGGAGVRFLVANLPDEACHREHRDSLVPFLRCDGHVNAVLERCGVGDAKIVVLSGLSFISRGQVAGPRETAGVFVSTAAPSDEWKWDLLHELGHAFGLRDERPTLTSRPGTAALTPGPNCASDEAEARRRWGDLLDSKRAGLFPGCAGHPRWLRPDKATIMDSARIQHEFGVSSGRYLRDAVRCCFGGQREGCAEAARRHPELLTCTR